MLTYNRTSAYAAVKKGIPVPRILDVDSFRQAWFMCIAFEKGMEMGSPPEDTLVFTKRQLGGNGSFEFYLEVLNGPLGKAFTAKFARHDEEDCYTKHQALVGEGHMKTHLVTCANTFSGSVPLACNRRPAYFDRKNGDDHRDTRLRVHSPII